MARMLDNQAQELVVESRLLFDHIGLLKRVGDQVVELPPTAKAGVARDGIISHVASTRQAVTHVPVCCEVALEAIN